MPQYKEDPWEVRYHAETTALRNEIAKREIQATRTAAAINAARVTLLRATLAVQSGEPKEKVIELLEQAMAVEVRATDPVVLAADEIMDEYRAKIKEVSVDEAKRNEINSKLLDSIEKLNVDRLPIYYLKEALQRIMEKLISM
jgi:hydroxypyruvate isomerase